MHIKASSSHALRLYHSWKGLDFYLLPWDINVIFSEQSEEQKAVQPRVLLTTQTWMDSVPNSNHTLAIV